MRYDRGALEYSVAVGIVLKRRTAWLLKGNSCMFFKNKKKCSVCGLPMTKLFNTWICEACDERRRAEKHGEYTELPAPVSVQCISGVVQGASFPLVSGILYYNG